MPDVLMSRRKGRGNRIFSQARAFAALATSPRGCRPSPLWFAPPCDESSTSMRQAKGKDEMTDELKTDSTHESGRRGKLWKHRC